MEHFVRNTVWKGGQNMSTLALTVVKCDENRVGGLDIIWSSPQ
jgi:hypothetical protein